MLVERPVVDDGLERNFNELGYSIGACKED